jgi:DNA-directed RNA polymerase subunit M/transcription elongation factor TFIIS
MERQWFQQHHLPEEWSGWNHPVFQEYKDKIDEENNFTENPITDVEAGAIDCEKCGSNQTFCQTKQVRSSDEGFTLFVTCVKCGANWVKNS